MDQQKSDDAVYEEFLKRIATSGPVELNPRSRDVVLARGSGFMPSLGVYVPYVLLPMPLEFVRMMGSVLLGVLLSLAWLVAAVVMFVASPVLFLFRQAALLVGLVFGCLELRPHDNTIRESLDARIQAVRDEMEAEGIDVSVIPEALPPGPIPDGVRQMVVEDNDR